MHSVGFYRKTQGMQQLNLRSQSSIAQMYMLTARSTTRVRTLLRIIGNEPCRYPVDYSLTTRRALRWSCPRRVASASGPPLGEEASFGSSLSPTLTRLATSVCRVFALLLPVQNQKHGWWCQIALQDVPASGSVCEECGPRVLAHQREPG